MFKRLFIALDIVFLLWTVVLVYSLFFQGGGPVMGDIDLFDIFALSVLTLPYLLVRFVIVGSALPFTKTK